MIGDSIMAIALVDELICNGDIPHVYTNSYVFDVVSNLLGNNEVFLLSDLSKSTYVIIIDFLSNKESAEIIRHNNLATKIGFPDGEMNYDINLKLPINYSGVFAQEIYLQALQLVNQKKNSSKRTFNIGNKWVLNNQKLILISPGAGNLNRCYNLSDFILLADRLIQIGFRVLFILGPSEIDLKYLIKEHKCVVSCSMSHTREILDLTKIVVVSEGGFMHICGFLGMPLLGLFRVAKAKNWFPYQLPHQMAIGHETNDYQNIVKVNLDIDLTVDRILTINSILGGLSE